MPSKIKFIYFDIGGVLLDWLAAFYSAAKQFNQERRDFIKILNNVSRDLEKGLLSPQKFWTLCKKELKINNDKNFDLMDSWTNDYFPIRTTHSLVNKLSKTYKIGLLSNLYPDMFNHLLKKELIPNIKYDQIILSSNIHSRKPENEIYKIAQSKSEANPTEILFIDDREDFLTQPRLLKWQCFKFNYKNPEESTRKLEKMLLKQ